MRTRLLLPAVGNGLPSLYQTTAGTGLPLVRQRRIRRCDFFTVTDSSSPNAAGALAATRDNKAKRLAIIHPDVPVLRRRPAPEQRPLSKGIHQSGGGAATGVAAFYSGVTSLGGSNDPKYEAYKVAIGRLNRGETTARHVVGVSRALKSAQRDKSPALYGQQTIPCYK